MLVVHGSAWPRPESIHFKQCGLFCPPKHYTILTSFSQNVLVINYCFLDFFFWAMELK